MPKSKKEVLFIMNNLNCGGAEKALISLLSHFDYSNYHVDLLLFKKEGLFLNQVPPEVTLLEEPYEYSFFDGSFVKAIYKALCAFRLDIVYYRLLFSFIYKKEKRNSVREQRVWKTIAATLKALSKEYDLAVGFLENKPNYFCVDKVNAKVKVGFIHNDYAKLELDSILDHPYFDRLDYVATISEECRASLQRVFPDLINKFIVVQNISSPQLIHTLASASIEPMEGSLKILTIGRLSPQKGYDLVIATAKLLKEQHIDFKWYIIGVGPLQNELYHQAKEYQLEQYVIFLGLKENPYPYLKACDLYVQPSRFEGKSIAIDEAKILHKPIVVTNFSTVKDQIQNEINGLVVSMDASSLQQEILRIKEDPLLKHRLVTNLLQEQLGNEDEVEKFYQIMN